MTGSIYRARNGRLLKVISHKSFDEYLVGYIALEVKDLKNKDPVSPAIIYHYGIKLENDTNPEWDLMELIESPIFKKEEKK